MKRVALALWVCVAVALPGVASARHPVVVELFTAQGCSSCAKANVWLGQIADRPGVIALTWSVDYWDYLGWKDSFAQPEYTSRQQSYERRFGLLDVYTPQVVVDGAAQSPGDKTADIDELIKQSVRSRRPEPQIRFLSDGRIGIGTGARPLAAAEVWLVRYDPRAQDVEVTAGDNSGAKVPLRNVVRRLTRLGAWSGRAIVFKKPDPIPGGLTTLILVQAARGGPIVATAQHVDASR